MPPRLPRRPGGGSSSPRGRSGSVPRSGSKFNKTSAKAGGSGAKFKFHPKPPKPRATHLNPNPPALVKGNARFKPQPRVKSMIGRTADRRPDATSRFTKTPPALRQGARLIPKILPSYEPEPSDQPQRLQKILAHAGIASRRACEELILQGRVTVNGETVREFGARYNPYESKIAIDGEPIKLEKLVYFAVNKPKGYLCSNEDPDNRPRVVDLLPEIPQRVYTIGRLDEASTGLILLTNDGELANKLTHPKFGVEKRYEVVVAGHPDRDVLRKLIDGVWLSDGKVRAKKVRELGRRGDSSILELVLAEGKNREIRRMLARLGHKVMSLTRVAVGPITLKGLRTGEVRVLGTAEVDRLKQIARTPFPPTESLDSDAGSSAPAQRDRDHDRSAKRSDLSRRSVPGFRLGGGNRFGGGSNRPLGRPVYTPGNEPPEDRSDRRPNRLGGGNRFGEGGKRPLGRPVYTPGNEPPEDRSDRRPNRLGSGNRNRFPVGSFRGRPDGPRPAGRPVTPQELRERRSGAAASERDESSRSRSMIGLEREYQPIFHDPQRFLESEAEKKRKAKMTLKASGEPRSEDTLIISPRPRKASVGVRRRPSAGKLKRPKRGKPSFKVSRNLDGGE